VIMPHLLFDPSKVSLHSYFASQAKQSGHGMPMFHGIPYQRGGSIGSIFRGLMKMLLPLAGAATRTVGKEAIHAGLNLASDALAGKNIKQSVKRRAKKAGNRLLKQAKVTVKQAGGGKKRKAPAKKRKAPAKKRKAPAKKRKRKPAKKVTRKRRRVSNYDF